MPRCSYCENDSESIIDYYDEENRKTTKFACLSCIQSAGIYCDFHHQTHLVKKQPDGKNPLHACPECIHSQILELDQSRRKELIAFIEQYRPSSIAECLLGEPFSVAGGTLDEHRRVLTKLSLIAELSGYTLETLLARQVPGRSDATLQ